MENAIAAGSRPARVCPHDARRLAPLPVRTTDYAPRITYVDDDAATLPRRALTAARARELLAEEDPTLKVPALSRRTTTLNPVMADATLERFLASPTVDDSDELSVMSTTSLRVRRVARFAVAGIVAASAALLANGNYTRAQSFTLGMDRPGAPEADGVLVGPESRSGETIFVDDRAVGTVPAPVTVACGVRTVRIGRAGSVRAIDVPCGGRVTL